MSFNEQNDQKRLTRLVREIIGGKPVTQIPTDMIPKVHQSLLSAKTKAIREGQVGRLQMIQKKLGELERLDKRTKLNTPRKNMKLPSSSLAPMKAESPPIPVLDSVLEDLIAGFPYDIAETKMLHHLINRSKDVINELLEKGEYKQAQLYENVHQRLATLIIEREQEEKIASKKAFVQEQLEKFQELLQEAEDKYMIEQETHESKFRSTIEEAEQEWENEMNEFDAVTNGPLPPPFRKWSSELLNLREKERFLLRSRRYEEAAGIKDEADQMEAEELEILQDRFIRTRETQKITLTEQHETKMKCIEEKGERIRKRIRAENEKNIENLRKTVENLEKRLASIDETGMDTPISQCPSSISTRAPSPTPSSRQKNPSTFVTQNYNPTKTPNLSSRSNKRTIYTQTKRTKSTMSKPSSRIKVYKPNEI